MRNGEILKTTRDLVDYVAESNGLMAYCLFCTVFREMEPYIARREYEEIKQDLDDLLKVRLRAVSGENQKEKEDALFLEFVDSHAPTIYKNLHKLRYYHG